MYLAYSHGKCLRIKTVKKESGNLCFTAVESDGQIIFDFSPTKTELIHSRVNIARIARFLFEF